MDNSDDNDLTDQFIQVNYSVDLKNMKDAGSSFVNLESFDDDEYYDEEDDNPIDETNGEPSFLNRLERSYPEYTPYLYICISAFSMVVNAYCAKMLIDTETFEILFLRSVVMFIILYFAWSRWSGIRGVKINDK